MRPLSVTIRNFLSYGDIPQRIDFQEYSFICLSGQNGNGKTAFLESIIWALWGIARKNQGVAKNDESLMRIGSESMFVALEFLVEEKKYLVKRSCEKKGKRINSELSFFISSNEEDEWKNLSLAHQKETQDLINTVVSLDYETFINTVFLRQGFSNEFSRKTPKERKDILAKILGIDRIERIREKILFEIKEKEPRINFLNHLKDSFNEEITFDQLEIIKNELFEKKDLYIKKKEKILLINNCIKAVENKKEETFKDLEEIIKFEKKNYDEISTLKNTLIRNFSEYKEIKKAKIYLKEKEKNYEKKYSFLEISNFLKNKNFEISEIEKFIKEKVLKKEKIEKLLFKIKNRKNFFDKKIKDLEDLIFAIKNKKCFYCNENLNENKKNIFLEKENKRKEIYEKKKNKINLFEKKLFLFFDFIKIEINKKNLEEVERKKELENLKILEKEIFEIEKIKNFLKEKDFEFLKKNLKEKIFEIKKLKENFDILSDKKFKIEEKRKIYLKEIESEIVKKEILEKELENEHKYLSEEYGKYLLKKENFEKFSKKKFEIENEYKEIISYYSIRSKLADILGKDSIQAALIEESIPELEFEANRILSKLSDGKCKIYIESTKDLKSGKAKESLEIIIEDIFGVRPYEFFSGGESFRIDLSIRIALSKILAKRSGSTIKTFIIDEGFGSQDGVALESIVQMLYSIQEIFDLIIIVSHLPFLKEEFPVHFVVNKGINGSVISIIE